MFVRVCFVTNHGDSEHIWFVGTTIRILGTIRNMWTETHTNKFIIDSFLPFQYRMYVLCHFYVTRFSISVLVNFLPLYFKFYPSFRVFICSSSILQPMTLLFPSPTCMFPTQPPFSSILSFLFFQLYI